MIVSSFTAVDASDVATYAWARLRRYLNVDYVADVIVGLHQLRPEHHDNARKQATQIRYCLTQAREYYDAARSVSMATKPVLLYYATMHLGLAEILLKQTGHSSLDAARAEHGHHGLEIRVESLPPGTRALTPWAESLRAVPRVDKHKRPFGTFGLWHRSCREMPLVGNHTRDYSSGGQTSGLHVLLMANDSPLPMLPSTGIDLLACFRATPGMGAFLNQHGVSLRLIRGKLEAHWQEWNKDHTRLTVIIHPTERALFEEFIGNVEVDPNAVDRVNLVEVPSGGIINFDNDANLGGVKVRFPHGSMWTADEIRFSPSTESLNEFGFMYVALFISGTFARYYSDKWMAAVERSTPLAQAIEELCEIGLVRVPLLALSELSRSYHVLSR
jgi:hypothetical protein